LSYHLDKQIIGVFDPFDNRTVQRIYVENAGQTNGSDNGYFIYIFVDSVKKYFTISPDVAYDPNTPDNLRYRLILKEKETNSQLLMRQWWNFRINLGYTGGYFGLFPSQIIRSNLQLNFSHNNTPEVNWVYISYDTNGNINLVNCSTLDSEQQKNTCTFLNDNRLFTIASSMIFTNQKKYLNATDEINELNIITTGAPGWRLEPTNHNFHIFGGTYYILTNRGITSAGTDKMLSNTGNNVSLVNNDTSDNAKWQFVFVNGTDSCLIKNVATGKILTINSTNNGFEMTDSYDCSNTMQNTDDNKKKRWVLTSVNHRIKE
jgi:hypothetical protein